ncbi:pseudouridine synthase [Comamonas sp. GB3 AK4-5]|uniref:pseudouridine synthase n=1 Tax=Comamonas sp. GB3 AK4-5 TaxID=3231487 RepID=UPI00351EEF69
MYNTHDPRVLPVRGGVKPSCVVLPSQGQGVVLDYLVQRLPLVARADWLRRMAQGEVVDEHGVCVAADTRFMPGVRIYYYREVESEPVVPFEAQLLYQDAHIVVADKPHFLPVTPGGCYLQNTLLVRLKRELGLPDLSPVHRIDRDTAGVVLFSVRREDRGAYQALFRDRQVHKTYEAVAPWSSQLQFPYVHSSRMEPSGDFIRMHEVPGAANSSTRIEVLEHNAQWGRYRLHPVSGKRHQLRVHMAALGLGLWGDALYPQVCDAEEGDFSRPLQLLARQLEFVDPVTGAEHCFASRRQLRALPAVTGTGVIAGEK